MFLGFTSLLSNILKRPQPASRKSRPATHQRKLVGEQLETRYALAADLVLPADPLPIFVENADLPSEIAPMAAEVVISAAATQDSPPPANPSPPTGGNLAPVITEFTFTSNGTWLSIHGHVTDDQDPTGYTVRIWGIATLNVIVANDDQFSFVVPLTPDTSGSIFAQTRDIYGLYSNIMSITI